MNSLSVLVAFVLAGVMVDLGQTGRTIGVPVSEEVKGGVFGADSCQAVSANPMQYCFGSGGGVESDCSGCGCQNVLFPRGMPGPIKCTVTTCLTDPKCTIDQMTDLDCKGY